VTAEVHKPKGGVRNWRELLGEIGVIVMSVMIALAVDQTAEAVHWAHTVDQAEHAMRLELRDDDDPQAYARLAASACIDGQLAAIQAALDAGKPADQVRAAALAFHGLYRTWDQEAWNALIGSDVASHVSPERMLRWSVPYRVMPSLADTNKQEMSVAAALTAGRHHEGPLTETEADRVAVTIEHLRELNVNMTRGAEVLLAGSHDIGVEVPAQVKQRTLAQLRASYGPCVVQPAPETKLLGPDRPDAVLR
jgi:hypothetical protein